MRRTLAHLARRLPSPDGDRPTLLATADRCAVERFGPVPGGGATRAICIARRESGLDPTATSGRPGQYLGPVPARRDFWPDRYEKYTRPAWELSPRALNGRTNAIVTIRMVVAIGGWKAPAGPPRAAEAAARPVPETLPAMAAKTRADHPRTEDRKTTVEERIDELRKRRKAALTPGGRDAAAKQHDRGKLTARERVELLMDTGSFVETDPFAVHRAHDFGMEQAAARRRRRHGLRHDRRAQGLRGVAGLHGLRRLDGRGRSPQKVCKVMDLALADRRAVHPDQRLRRRADPGGRRVARRLRLHLRAQRARERRDPADLA